MQFNLYDREYRENLDILCTMIGFVNIVFFDTAKAFIPESLEIVGFPDSKQKQVNCHGYAFGKNCWFEVKNVHELINSQQIKESLEPEQGDIIVYYLRDDTDKIPIIKHTGIYLGSCKVKSKWASGPIFIHDVFNVPYTYGEIVKFFKL